jgi:hypothetical protein
MIKNKCPTLSFLSACRYRWFLPLGPWLLLPFKLFDFGENVRFEFLRFAAAACLSSAVAQRPLRKVGRVAGRVEKADVGV